MTTLVINDQELATIGIKVEATAITIAIIVTIVFALTIAIVLIKTPQEEITRAANQATLAMIGIFVIKIRMVLISEETKATTTTIGIIMVLTEETPTTRIVGITIGTRIVITDAITMDLITAVITMIISRVINKSSITHLMRLNQTLLLAREAIIICNSWPERLRLRLGRVIPTISICMVWNHRAAVQVALGLPMAGLAMMVAITAMDADKG